MAQSLSEKIRSTRIGFGLTQKEIALAVGTKQPAISRLENGGADDCSLRTLRKLALVLNLKLEVNFDEQKPKRTKASELGSKTSHKVPSLLHLGQSTFLVQKVVETASTHSTITTNAEDCRP